MDERPICFIIFIFLFLPCDIEGRAQTLTLHHREDCSDQGEVIQGNVRNLEKFSFFVKCGLMKCFCNHYGVWIYSANTHYKRGFYPETSGLKIMEHPVGKTCQSIRFNSTFIQLKSVRHIGSPDSELPALSLYNETDFYGKELYIRGSSVSLLTPIIFRSFGMTGSGSGSGSDWTIYPKINFEGNSTCLRGKRMSKIVNANDTTTSVPAFNITFQPNQTLLVGSIRQNCYAKERQRKFTEKKNYLVLYTTKTHISRKNDQTTKREGKLVIDALEFRLISPILFNSFAVVGSESWTIYSGTEFNGQFTCFSPDGLSNNREVQRRFKRNDKNKNTNVLALADKKNRKVGDKLVLIGSVKRGCGHTNHCMDHEEDEVPGDAGADDNLVTEFSNELDLDVDGTTTVKIDEKGKNPGSGGSATYYIISDRKAKTTNTFIFLVIYATANVWNCILL